VGVLQHLKTKPFHAVIWKTVERSKMFWLCWPKQNLDNLKV